MQRFSISNSWTVPCTSLYVGNYDALVYPIPKEVCTVVIDYTMPYSALVEGQDGSLVYAHHGIPQVPFSLATQYRLNLHEGTVFAVSSSS